MHLRFSIKFVLVQTFRMDYIASTLFILFYFHFIIHKTSISYCLYYNTAKFVSVFGIRVCVCVWKPVCTFPVRRFYRLRSLLFVIRGIRFSILQRTVLRNEWDSIQNVWASKRPELSGRGNEREREQSQWVDRFLWLFILAICWWNMVHVNVFRCMKHGQNKNAASSIQLAKQ